MSGDTKTIEALIAELGDPDQSVRAGAAFKLMERGDEAAPAVEALAQVVKDGGVVAPMYAAQTLGDLGPAAEAALPVLKDALLHRRNREIVSTLTVAIQKIEGRFSGPSRAPTSGFEV